MNAARQLAAHPTNQAAGFTVRRPLPLGVTLPVDAGAVIK